MATYNILGYTNDGSEPPVVLTVELNENDTEVIDLTGADEEALASARSALDTYISVGMSAIAAVDRLAGSYGEVEKVGTENE